MFAGELIVCNGLDKPLLINFDNSPNTDYLQDLASGSNTNTPIARYVTTVGKYVVMAGNPTNEDRVYISNSLTSGTWAGDAAPNDAVNIDLGKEAPTGLNVIRGIARFRDRLIVGFDEASVIGTLGTYSDSGDHIPDFSDVVEYHGTISHRSMISVGDDLFMLDVAGVTSLRRATFTDAIRPQRTSELINPLIQARTRRLTTAELIDKTFAIYERDNSRYMVFLPNHSASYQQALTSNPIFTDVGGSGDLVIYARTHGLEVGDSFTLSGVVDAFDGIAASTLNATHVVSSIIDDDYFRFTVSDTADVGGVAGGGNALVLSTVRTSSIGFVHTYNPELRIDAWTEFRGLNVQCGCISQLGRVFLAVDDEILVLGSVSDEITGDYEAKYDATWATTTAFTVDQRVRDPITGTIYTCLIAHTSGPNTMASDVVLHPEWWSQYNGLLISGSWELPWADFNDRMALKILRHVSFDTRGHARFNAMMFHDNIYSDPRTGSLTPISTMEFVGGDIGGFGIAAQPFGGGRQTDDERLWAFPGRGKLIKFRFEAASDRALRFVALSITYMLGGIRRQ